MHTRRSQVLAAIGNRIRSLRLSLNLSLDQLAERASLSKTGIWQIETGKSEPQALTLMALAEALETSVDFLLLRCK